MSGPGWFLAGAGCGLLAWWLAQRARAAALRRAVEAEAALAELRRERDGLAAGVQGATGGLLVCDANGILVLANELACALAGLPAGAWQGRRLAELLPWPKLVDHLPPAAGTAAGEVAFEQDLQGDPAEPGRALGVRIRPTPSGGCVVAIDDHSRLKRLESLRRDFVANVSHELKTPLAAIQGFVETMQDDAEMPAETRQRFLERIARQVHRLGTLVQDLLTLSRLDEQRPLDGPVVPQDLAALVREVGRDLQPLADKRRIVLRVQVPAAPLWLAADAEALRQVVGNLVDNAIKYTPEGGMVAVSLADQAGRARLEVVDTGIGLSPDDQERVFERFYRVDRARSRELGGTGLGLSIVKNTVRNLGGEVGVRSAIGRGSTFWVEWPLAPPVG